MTAWLLVMFIGYHQGYITVPGIASEQACRDLAFAINASKQGALLARPHDCIPYTASK